VSKFEIAVRLYKSYLITEALERFHGNQSATARNLGLHRNSLRRNIKVLGIKLAEQGSHGVRKPPAGVKAPGSPDRAAFARAGVRGPVEMPACSSDQREA
jgi:hypothetical protein